jgi:uncharacterized membrane protein YecN with MAPEG domain
MVKRGCMILASFLMKLVICPAAVIIASYLLPNLNYSTLYQPIIVGLVLAAAGVMMEYLFLKEGTIWISTGMDFVASVLIVYFVSLLFVGASVTFFGAVLVGLLLAITEYFTHRWLVQTGKAQKSPA